MFLRKPYFPDKTIYNWVGAGDARRIYESGVFYAGAQGRIYGMDNPEFSWLDSTTSSKRDDLVIFSQGAAEYFRRHAAYGALSGFKRLRGQYRTGFHDLAFYRLTPNDAELSRDGKTLVIRRAYRNKHRGWRLFQACVRVAAWESFEIMLWVSFISILLIVSSKLSFYLFNQEIAFVENICKKINHWLQSAQSESFKEYAPGIIVILLLLAFSAFFYIWKARKVRHEMDPHRDIPPLRVSQWPWEVILAQQVRLGRLRP